MALLGGAATCSEGFVKCFLRVPRLLGCTAAAMLPKQATGAFRKHITKPLEQVAAPPSIEEYLTFHLTCATLNYPDIYVHIASSHGL